MRITILTKDLKTILSAELVWADSLKEWMVKNNLARLGGQQYAGALCSIVEIAEKENWRLRIDGEL